MIRLYFEGKKEKKLNLGRPQCVLREIDPNGTLLLLPSRGASCACLEAPTAGSAPGSVCYDDRHVADFTWCPAIVAR
eukprot:1136497-Rhodomonas_salina.1